MQADRNTSLKLLIVPVKCWLSDLRRPDALKNVEAGHKCVLKRQRDLEVICLLKVISRLRCCDGNSEQLLDAYKDRQ